MTDAASAIESTTIEKQAAFLKNNGSVVSLDGTSILSFNHSIIHSLFVVVRHRNHIDIMSANSLAKTEGVYAYDFSTSINQVYSGSSGYKTIASGIFGMAVGETDASWTVDISDKTIWETSAGAKGYFPGDLNLDRQVNNPDKDDNWILNTEIISSHVPD